jgi:hypothetical protein
MSTSPDTQRTDDQIVTLLSHWLMGSVGNDELRKRIEEIGTAELAPGQRAAVEELLVELRNALRLAGLEWPCADAPLEARLTASNPGNPCFRGPFLCVAGRP